MRLTDGLIQVFQVPFNALDTVLELCANILYLVNVHFTVQKHAPLGELGLGIAQGLTYFTTGEEIGQSPFTIQLAS